MSIETAAAIKSTQSELKETNQTGFFNLTTIANNKVADKRKRKGLGEIKPREKSVYRQFF